MSKLSVAEAAKLLGVGVARVHQRIVDGSLPAERTGSQWAIDERSVLQAVELRAVGRPLSARSVWALIALAEEDADALSALHSYERARTRSRLEDLIALALEPPRSEAAVLRIAVGLRTRLRTRARRVLRRAAPPDLAALGRDPRWDSLLDSSITGIASVDVDGYLGAPQLEPLSTDFLLSPANEDANVIIHVLPEGQKAYPNAKIQAAADLAEYRSPREELRAAELLHEVANTYERRER